MVFALQCQLVKQILKTTNKNKVGSCFCLVTTGGMGGEALTFYRRLADMLSRHSSTSYSGTLAWIRCTLSFSLLRSATTCIRGTRSILHRSNNASSEMGHIAGPIGTFSCPPFSCPAHLLLGAGGGRQGQYIQPGRKNKEKTRLMLFNRGTLLTLNSGGYSVYMVFQPFE